MNCETLIERRASSSRGGKSRGKRPVSRGKAREILHHGEVHGHPLTDKQRRFFGHWSNE